MVFKRFFLQPLMPQFLISVIIMVSGEKFKSTEFLKNKDVFPFLKFETLNLGINEVKFMMIYDLPVAEGLRPLRIFL